jgi:hypothetical protein
MPIIPLLIAGMLCLQPTKKSCLNQSWILAEHPEVFNAFMQDLNIFPIILYEVRWGAVHVFPIPETHKLTS